MCIPGVWGVTTAEASAARTAIINATVGLAKAFTVPVVLTTVAAEPFSGPILLFDLGEGPADVLLRLLMADQHRMPMTRLAHDAGMSSGGFTKLADRLCTAGLAGRVACEADRRVTYLELTDKGEETAESIARVATQSLRERVLSAIGPEGFGVLTDTMRRPRDANDDQGKARRTTSRRTPEAPPAR
ncbi:MarR family winged helix-turn-helix transcriptional regulator [Micromonospora sp. WMMD710]|uniref:MarR family winged helix-turn-helix transcriptional regulator n=1 Tax=Micromonospora sp. WMMD710 TaxID=3016085 RepID=UPI002415C74E|nr:MarR family winged helix-turn-helix transcriptional regulator [Micromonospora sp. WMMD710]MDG4759987.1 MarR family winged helix-turn-helix transcriptional regulator [Micromonospora sp. WMMD710]